MRTMYISPNHKEEEFSSPLTLEDKIEIFRDRVDGWQLGIADQCINGKIANTDQSILPIRDSGFAVLHIVMSYFEMIAKYEDGFTDKGKSCHYFKMGLASVFPSMQGWETDKFLDELTSILYDSVRCGLYHCGITNPLIVLTGDIENPIIVDRNLSKMIINPHLLIPHMRIHLQNYVIRLSDLANKQLRANFQKRWEWQHSQQAYT